MTRCCGDRAPGGTYAAEMATESADAGKVILEHLREAGLLEDADRFWSKVDTNNSNCWLWVAGKTRTGYGTFSANGEMFRSHRVAWVLANSRDIPIGKIIMHLCDNPSCCNPAHLRLGTQADNALDRGSKGRTARGELSGRAKLGSDDVLEIRKLYTAGSRCGELSEAYGVTKASVMDIVTRRNWSWLEEK